MYIGVFSMRYAKALLAYANESGVEDRVYEEAKRLADTYTLVPDLRQAVENPVLPVKTKLQLICEAAGGAGVSKEMKRFAQLVLQERREKFFQFMIMSYIDLYRKQKNISVGKITTVCPVSDEVVNRIRAMVTEKTHGTVEFRTRLDEKLEGGFIFEINFYRMDASIANQIRRVKRQFIAKNRRIV
ncbi:F0F1 ATP synthase subunit delta [Phocaeicola sp.]|jgi:F-type H+-transporting ATPase subunit delta